MTYEVTPIGLLYRKNAKIYVTPIKHCHIIDSIKEGNDTLEKIFNDLSSWGCFDKERLLKDIQRLIERGFLKVKRGDKQK